MRSFRRSTVKDRQGSSLYQRPNLDLDVLVAKQDIRIEDPAMHAGSEASMKKQCFGLTFRHFAAILFTLLLAQGSLLLAQQPPAPPPPGADPGQPAPLLSPNQLQDLVAPIALYPDPILSQVLVASTYPLEVMEAYQWLQRNPGLTGAAPDSSCGPADLGSQRAGVGDVCPTS